MHDLDFIRFVDNTISKLSDATSNTGSVKDPYITILTRRYIYTYKESVTKCLYSPILDLELKNPEAWFEKKYERARFSIRYGY